MRMVCSQMRNHIISTTRNPFHVGVGLEISPVFKGNSEISQQPVALRAAYRFLCQLQELTSSQTIPTRWRILDSPNEHFTLFDYSFRLLRRSSKAPQQNSWFEISIFLCREQLSSVIGIMRGHGLHGRKDLSSLAFRHGFYLGSSSYMPTFSMIASCMFVAGGRNLDVGSITQISIYVICNTHIAEWTGLSCGHWNVIWAPKPEFR